MALNNHHVDRVPMAAPVDNRIQNQPTSTSETSLEEAIAEGDEPPDLQCSTTTAVKQLPQDARDFTKQRCALERKQSLLTRSLQVSESDSNQEDESLFSDPRRAHSSASTWSRGSVASTADFTSDGHSSPARMGTPSPPLPPTQAPLALSPTFSHKPLDSHPMMRSPTLDSIDPQKPMLSSNEGKVEAGLGRKRCITFACGRKEEAKKEEPPRVDSTEPAEPPKRPCSLRFVCPSRDSTSLARPPKRHTSPPPTRKATSPPKASRAHRGSDSTVRNTSPKAVRKQPPAGKPRRTSEDSEVDRYEATRFHEFASSEEEIDDWTQEKTCHKSRLTVVDTLGVENNLRKLGTEAEEEAMDEEDELDEEGGDFDEELEEDEEDEEAMTVDPHASGYVSDEGFRSDDEEGFARSDDENEEDSEDEWWAPRRGRDGSAEPLEQRRPTSRRSDTNSSIGSMGNGQTIPTPAGRVGSRPRKTKSPIKSRAPELPDSTDFVCGTLDEDRPMEQAYLNALRQRQASKHKTVPQDFDPTFPTSDLDEEDEESQQDIISDSEPHMFMHGKMDPHVDKTDLRAVPNTVIPRKRSPPPPRSPPPRTRVRSPAPTKHIVHRSPPPPTKRVVHRSPPPPMARRGLLFGQSSERHRSPLPHNARPLRSPPPTRRSSFEHNITLPVPPAVLASRPRRPGLASSLPRNGPDYVRKPLQFLSDDDDTGNTGDYPSTDALPTRGAIDIVRGLEKKRQRRREKLFEKHCRLREQGKLKIKDGVKKCPKGMGAERMREVGLECAALRGHRRMVWRDGNGEGATHILSY